LLEDNLLLAVDHHVVLALHSAVQRARNEDVLALLQGEVLRSCRARRRGQTGGGSKTSVALR
jgi:hypothetical protein